MTSTMPYPKLVFLYLLATYGKIDFHHSYYAQATKASFFFDMFCVSWLSQSFDFPSHFGLLIIFPLFID